uniref:ATP-binding cassette sub-family A member 13 n=1 Tax=Eptatretus burgeri TaxID=7764 RepID=A0A8C4QTF4_EPTBU
MHPCVQITGSSLSNKYILPRMSIIRQTYLLCWKNWRSFVHSPILPLAVVIWPCIVAVIIAILRSQEERIYEPNCYLPPQSLPSSGFLPFVESLVCDWKLECENQPEGVHTRTHRHTRSAERRENENFLEVLRSFGQPSTLTNDTNKLKHRIQKLVDSFEQHPLNTSSMEELTQFIRHVHQTFSRTSKQNPEGISGRDLKKVLCLSLLPNNQTNPLFPGELNMILQRWCLSDDPLVVVGLEAFEMMKNEAFGEHYIVMDLLAGNSSILDKVEECIVWLEEAHSWSGLWRMLLRWLGNTRFDEGTWHSPMKVIGETLALLEDIWEAADSFPWHTNFTAFEPVMEGLIKTLKLTLQNGLSAKENHSTVLVEGFDLLSEFSTNKLAPLLASMGVNGDIDAWKQSLHVAREWILLTSQVRRMNHTERDSPVVAMLDTLQQSLEMSPVWQDISVQLSVDQAIRDVLLSMLNTNTDVLTFLKNLSYVNPSDKEILDVNITSSSNVEVLLHHLIDLPIARFRQVMLGQSNSSCAEILWFWERNTNLSRTTHDLNAACEAAIVKILHNYTDELKHHGSFIDASHKWAQLWNGSFEVLVPVTLSQTYLGWEEVHQAFRTYSEAYVAFLLDMVPNVDAKRSEEQLFGKVFLDVLDLLGNAFEQSDHWPMLQSFVQSVRAVVTATNQQMVQGFHMCQDSDENVKFLSNSSINWRDLVNELMNFFNNAKHNTSTIERAMLILLQVHSHFSAGASAKSLWNGVFCNEMALLHNRRLNNDSCYSSASTIARHFLHYFNLGKHAEPLTTQVVVMLIEHLRLRAEDSLFACPPKDQRIQSAFHNIMLSHEWKVLFQSKNSSNMIISNVVTAINQAAYEMWTQGLLDEKVHVYLDMVQGLIRANNPVQLLTGLRRILGWWQTTDGKELGENNSANILQALLAIMELANEENLADGQLLTTLNLFLEKNPSELKILQSSDHLLSQVIAIFEKASLLMYSSPSVKNLNLLQNLSAEIMMHMQEDPNAKKYFPLLANFMVASNQLKNVKNPEKIVPAMMEILERLSGGNMMKNDNPTIRLGCALEGEAEQVASLLIQVLHNLLPTNVSGDFMNETMTTLCIADYYNQFLSNATVPFDVQFFKGMSRFEDNLVGFLQNISSERTDELVSAAQAVNELLSGKMWFGEEIQRMASFIAHLTSIMSPNHNISALISPAYSQLLKIMQDIATSNKTLRENDEALTEANNTIRFLKAIFNKNFHGSLHQALKNTMLLKASLDKLQNALQRPFALKDSLPNLRDLVKAFSHLAGETNTDKSVKDLSDGIIALLNTWFLTLNESSSLEPNGQLQFLGNFTEYVYEDIDSLLSLHKNLMSLLMTLHETTAYVGSASPSHTFTLILQDIMAVMNNFTDSTSRLEEILFQADAFELTLETRKKLKLSKEQIRLYVDNMERILSLPSGTALDWDTILIMLKKIFPPNDESLNATLPLNNLVSHLKEVMESSRDPSTFANIIAAVVRMVEDDKFSLDRTTTSLVQMMQVYLGINPEAFNDQKKNESSENVEGVDNLRALIEVIQAMVQPFGLKRDDKESKEYHTNFTELVKTLILQVHNDSREPSPCSAMAFVLLALNDALIIPTAPNSLLIAAGCNETSIPNEGAVNCSLHQNNNTLCSAILTAVVFNNYSTYFSFPQEVLLKQKNPSTLDVFVCYIKGLQEQTETLVKLSEIFKIPRKAMSQIYTRMAWLLEVLQTNRSCHRFGQSDSTTSALLTALYSNHSSTYTNHEIYSQAKLIERHTNELKMLVRLSQKMLQSNVWQHLIHLGNVSDRAFISTAVDAIIIEMQTLDLLDKNTLNLLKAIHTIYASNNTNQLMLNLRGLLDWLDGVQGNSSGTDIFYTLLNTSSLLDEIESYTPIMLHVLQLLQRNVTYDEALLFVEVAEMLKKTTSNVMAYKSDELSVFRNILQTITNTSNLSEEMYNLGKLSKWMKTFVNVVDEFPEAFKDDASYFDKIYEIMRMTQRRLKFLNSNRSSSSLPFSVLFGEQFLKLLETHGMNLSAFAMNEIVRDVEVLKDLESHNVWEISMLRTLLNLTENLMQPQFVTDGNISAALNDKVLELLQTYLLETRTPSRENLNSNCSSLSIIHQLISGNMSHKQLPSMILLQSSCDGVFEASQNVSNCSSPEADPIFCTASTALDIVKILHEMSFGNSLTLGRPTFLNLPEILACYLQDLHYSINNLLRIAQIVDLPSPMLFNVSLRLKQLSTISKSVNMSVCFRKSDAVVNARMDMVTFLFNMSTEYNQNISELLKLFETSNLSLETMSKGFIQLLSIIYNFDKMDVKSGLNLLSTISEQIPELETISPLINKVENLMTMISESQENDTAASQARITEVKLCNKLREAWMAHNVFPATPNLHIMLHSVPEMMESGCQVMRCKDALRAPSILRLIASTLSLGINTIQKSRPVQSWTNDTCTEMFGDTGSMRNMTAKLAANTWLNKGSTCHCHTMNTSHISPILDGMLAILKSVLPSDVHMEVTLVLSALKDLDAYIGEEQLWQKGKNNTGNTSELWGNLRAALKEILIGGPEDQQHALNISLKILLDPLFGDFSYLTNFTTDFANENATVQRVKDLVNDPNSMERQLLHVVNLSVGSSKAILNASLTSAKASNIHTPTKALM